MKKNHLHTEKILREDKEIMQGVSFLMLPILFFGCLYVGFNVAAAIFGILEILALLVLEGIYYDMGKYRGR